MDVRKYEALNMQDAVKLIKKELGRDAVILATREKETTLPGQKHRTKMVEVVAAAAATSTSTTSSNTATSSTQTTSSASSSSLGSNSKSAWNDSNVQTVRFPKVEKESDIRIVRGSPIMNALRPETRQKLSQNLENANARLQRQDQEQMRNRPAVQKVQNRTVTDDMLFQSPNTPQNASNNHATSTSTQTQTQTQNQEMQEIRQDMDRLRRDLNSGSSFSMNTEVQEIKVLLHDLMKGRVPADACKYPDYLTNIAIKMRAAGVLESVLTELLDTVSSLPIPTNADKSALAPEKVKEFYLNNLIRLIFKNINVASPIWTQNSGQTIHCLVGPTGVGKTTTIAKLAASLKIERGKTVALATMDTFRISAADQLRTYAKILDVPFQTIDDPSDVLSFAERHHNYDCLFIDTAGRVARDAPHIESLKALKDVDVPIHFHLAIPSTMKQRDIDETVRAFSFLSLESIIFTKLDESWNYGEILNTAVRSKLPLSYFATGQRVPEDLEVANKERIVERLFQL